MKPLKWIISGTKDRQPGLWQKEAKDALRHCFTKRSQCAPGNWQEVIGESPSTGVPRRAGKSPVRERGSVPGNECCVVEGDDHGEAYTVIVWVTGGAGFVGAHTCKELAAHGFQPIAFDNLSRGHREKPARRHDCDRQGFAPQRRGAAKKGRTSNCPVERLCPRCKCVFFSLLFRVGEGH